MQKTLETLTLKGRMTVELTGQQRRLLLSAVNDALLDGETRLRYNGPRPEKKANAWERRVRAWYERLAGLRQLQALLDPDGPNPKDPIHTV